VTIQRVTPRDEGVTVQCAEIHQNEIHEGFLSTLGRDFLVVLYGTLAGSEHAFVFAAVDGERVFGFIVGAMDTGAVYKEFMRRAGLKAVYLLAPKLFSFRRIKRIFETVLYPRRKKEDDLPEPEILNFCVRSDLQGQGVGSALFKELRSEFSRRGVEQIRIVTGETQRSAQTFYEKRGARLAANIEVHKDTVSRVYVFDI
jgi:ribosomal protein S18 acetylase RimI-like enzyme